MLELIDLAPAHDCPGRACDVCAEAVGAIATGVTPAYMDALRALSDAHEATRRARTLGEYAAARASVAALRNAAVGLAPIGQRVTVPAC